MKKTALIAVVLGGLLAHGPVASAQPLQPDRPAQAAQPGERAEPARPAQPLRGLQPPPERSPDVPAPATSSNPFPEPNVVLEDLVQRVAEASGRQFLIHMPIPARIYVRGTLPETPSYPVLLSILASNDLAVFEAEGIVNIVRAANARQLPSRIVQVDNDSIPDDEVVTRVLTVPAGYGISATQLVPILRPLQPQNAHLTALAAPGDAETASKLVIVDRYANVKRITEVIREIVGSVGL